MPQSMSGKKILQLIPIIIFNLVVETQKKIKDLFLKKIKKAKLNHKWLIFNIDF